MEISERIHTSMFSGGKQHQHQQKKNHGEAEFFVHFYFVPISFGFAKKASLTHTLIHSEWKQHYDNLLFHVVTMQYTSWAHIHCDTLCACDWNTRSAAFIYDLCVYMQFSMRADLFASVCTYMCGRTVIMLSLCHCTEVQRKIKTRRKIKRVKKRRKSAK